MSTPTDSPRDELAALRERAYGRNADILDDPVALARLSELEEQAAAASAASMAASAARMRIPTNGGSPRRSTVEVDGEDPDQLAVVPSRSEEADAAAAPHTGPAGREADDSAAIANDDPRTAGARAGRTDASDAAHDPGDDAVDPDTSEVADTAPARPWWRRLPVLWAASLIAAMMVGAALTLLVQSMEAGKVGVLQVDPDAEWPRDVWGGPTEDSRAFESFYGLSVLSQPQLTGDGSQAPVPCLIVFSGVGDNPSYLGGSCGAGSFPAEAALVVGTRAPSELRDRFSVGTALQFVLDGEQVHVYAREPIIVEPTP
ncbi:hypothetical protein [Microbacterium sp. NPDC056569]|uniref:hypothetical protein n=1 Tax=Microbacterium sp. NPDC056569 TaxID=3345867 RepID=UPI00366F31B4